MICLLGHLRSRDDPLQLCFFFLYSGNINGGNCSSFLVVKKDLKKKKKNGVSVSWYSNRMRLC